ISLAELTIAKTAGRESPSCSLGETFMGTSDVQRLLLSRRSFLSRASMGVGSLALASLLNPKLVAGEREAMSVRRHVAPRVRRVIWLYMAGGMSHLETFDYKPDLAKMHGKLMPESFTKGQPIAQLQGAKLNCFGPQHEFKRYGKSGQEFSSIFPYLG